MALDCTEEMAEETKKEKKWTFGKEELFGLLILFLLLSALIGSLLLIYCSTRQLITSLIALDIGLLQLFKILFSDLIGAVIIWGVITFLSFTGKQK